MADAKITALTSTTAGAMASTDVFVLVDVSDTTMAGSGTDKQIRTDDLASTVATFLPASSVQVATVIGFGEAVQDVMGVTLQSTSTIIFTYNDAGNAETASVAKQLDASWVTNFTSSVSSFVYANYLPLIADGKSVENAGAIESNVNTVTSTTTSACSLDVSVYGVHDVTMGSTNCTFTFLNPAPSGKATVFVLTLRGAQTPTFPAAVKWSAGAAPTYATPTIYTFATVDAGTTWYGQSVGSAFA